MGPALCYIYLTQLTEASLGFLLVYALDAVTVDFIVFVDLRCHINCLCASWARGICFN